MSHLSHLPPSSRISGAATDTRSFMSLSSLATTHVVTTHPETMLLRLQADDIGYGMSLQGGAAERAVYPIVIASIEDGGPAARYVRMYAYGIQVFFPCFFV